jgi:hypothetical protein
VKKTKFTNSPHPRTNIKEGFQSLLKAKNPIILVLLTIPATIKPAPKSKPTKKMTN